MFSIMKENNKIYNGLTEFIADSSDDLENLPTDVSPGSQCLIIEPFSVYVLNNQKQWIQIA